MSERRSSASRRDRRAAPRRARADKPAALVFRGPPNRLAAALPEPASRALSIPGAPAEMVSPRLEARLPGVDVETVATHGPRGEGPVTLRLQIAAATPPGRYEGEVQVGQDRIPIVAEVAPRPKVRASPRPIWISAAPGSDAEASVILANVGNVACDVSGRSTIGLLADGALGRAFWRALTFPEREGKPRIDRFVDDLAGEAATLRVTIPAGAGTLEPGESREVLLSVRLPADLVAGRRYAGTWEPEGLRLPVRVDATPAPGDAGGPA
jgi:hypothetical protein